MKLLDLGEPIEMRLHSTNEKGICIYCGATSKQIKSGKAGACEDYEKRMNKIKPIFRKCMMSNCNRKGAFTLKNDSDNILGFICVNHKWSHFTKHGRSESV